MAQASSVLAWLHERKRITVPDDWLEACIEWVLSENEGPALSQADLCNAVYEQWLVADLRELGASCLPSDAAVDAKYLLSGYYALQINSVADVSHSFYSQLQKVTGTENSNVHITAADSTQKPANDSVAGRMLMMQLTDGTTDIKGMEYRPITTLDVHLTPGLKILVYGSVLCRSGVMMLTADNVMVLGGEVESLADGNRPEQIITSKLGENVRLCENRPDLPRSKYNADGQPSNGSDRLPLGEIVQKPPSAGLSSSFRSPLAREVAAPRVTSACPVSKSERSQTVDSRARLSSGQVDFSDDDDDIFISSTLEADVMNSQVRSGQFIPNASACGLHGSSAGSSGTDAGKRVNPRSDSTPEVTLKKSKMEFMDVDDFDDDDFENHLSAEMLSSNPRHSSDRSAKGAAISPTESAVSCPAVMGFSSRAKFAEFQNSGPLLPGTNSEACGKGKSQVGLNGQLRDVTRLPAVSRDESVRRTNSMQQTIVAFSTSRTNATSLKAETPQFSGTQVAVTASSRSSRAGENSDSRSAGVSSVCGLNSSGALGGISELRLKREGASSKPQVTASTNEILNDEVASCGRAFKVKAYIATLLSRLEYNSGRCWSLTVKINDGSATLDADISNEMLTSLIGITAEESLMIKEGKTDKQSRLRLTEGVRRCQETLTSMSAILEISMDVDSRTWIVGRYRPVTSQDIDALTRRVGCIT